MSESETTYDASTEFDRWKASAARAAASALDIYTEPDDVERELALHLSRALRELDRCV